MPESIIPEAIEDEAAEARRSIDLASAYALREAERTKETSAVATAFLLSHKELIDLEVAHFHEDHERTRRAATLKRISGIFRVVTQFAFAIIGIGIAAGVAAMWWGAFSSRAVIVDRFEAPGSMSESGLTGTVVAGKVLDHLLAIQDSTRLSAAKQEIEGAWSNSIEIEIPESGVSLAEVNNALHRTFGHDTHIDGALTRTSGGMELSIRGNGIPPASFEGGTEEIDNLTRRAAEYVYGHAQPVLYATYLTSKGRQAEAIAYIRDAYPRASRDDRAVLANLWGEAFFMMGKVMDADRRFQFALNIDPHNWRAWNSLIGILPQTRGEEAAYQSGMEMQKEAARLPARSRPSLFDQANFAELILDPGTVIAGLMADRQLAQSEGAEYDASSWIAEQEAVRHDWRAVDTFLAESPLDDVTTPYDIQVLGGLRAMDAAEYGKAVGMFEAARKLWQASAQLQAFFPDFECELGNAYAQAGRLEDAMPLLADGRFVRCRGFLADALDKSAQWELAEKSYLAAERAAPHLSFAYYREGLALARHGNPSGALQKLQTARRLSPHWAEPGKAMGDIFASQGEWKQAVDAYDQAFPFAPAWANLQKARAAAHAKTRSQQ